MNTWILLIMVWAGASDGGMHTQMVEYKTKAECEKAAAQLIEANKDNRWRNVRGLCFQGKLKGGKNG